MSISQLDIKLLWGRAAARCCFPGCRTVLSQSSPAVGEPYVLGQQAHIVAREDNGPRGQSPLSLEERDSYSNLILLCPTHHTMIDKDPSSYPVELLHKFKSDHELWACQALSNLPSLQDEANSLVYASLIDAVTTLCELDSWHSWVTNAASLDHVWKRDTGIRVSTIRNSIVTAIWPKTLSELEDAIVSLSIAFTGAWELFRLHSKPRGDYYEGDKFYKGIIFNDNYDRDFDLYEQWGESCNEWLFEATRAANWFADCVRRDINPAFFATRGKFSFETGPYEDFRQRTHVPEFSIEERDANPEALMQELMKLRNEQDAGIVAFFQRMEGDGN